MTTFPRYEFTSFQRRKRIQTSSISHTYTYYTLARLLGDSKTLWMYTRGQLTNWTINRTIEEEGSFMDENLATVSPRWLLQLFLTRFDQLYVKLGSSQFASHDDYDGSLSARNNRITRTVWQPYEAPLRFDCLYETPISLTTGHHGDANLIIGRALVSCRRLVCVR